MDRPNWLKILFLNRRVKNKEDTKYRFLTWWPCFTLLSVWNINKGFPLRILNGICLGLATGKYVVVRLFSHNKIPDRNAALWLFFDICKLKHFFFSKTETGYRRVVIRFISYPDLGADHSESFRNVIHYNLPPCFMTNLVKYDRTSTTFLNWIQS